jgi:hypothetical protein
MRGNITETLNKVIAKKESTIERHQNAIAIIKDEIKTLKEVIENETKKQTQLKK